MNWRNIKRIRQQEIGHVFGLTTGTPSVMMPKPINVQMYQYARPRGIRSNYLQIYKGGSNGKLIVYIVNSNKKKKITII